MVKQIATQQFEKALQEQKFDYTQLSTRPAPFSTILWNANIDTPDAYLIADYSFFDTQPIQFKKYPKKYPKIDLGKCCFCALCEDICPKHCLKLTKNVFLSTFDKSTAIKYPTPVNISE